MTIRTKTDFLVVHCAATKANQDIKADTIRKWHMEKGWSDIGYHYVIDRDGTLEAGRPLNQVGAHVEGYNSRSVGICLVGGLAADGKHGENNFNPAQFVTLKDILGKLKKDYPQAIILGHRDLSPDRNHDGKITPDEWLKECPSFDVRAWLVNNPI